MSNLNELNPFGKFCCSIGHLPSSYMESLSYEEQLNWFCDFLKNKVLPNINKNTSAIEDLQNYFENLDVQDEINNKLDEMAESGELVQIISEFLNLPSLICYNTLDDLKNTENIVKDSFCKTYGESNYNDGKGHFFKIREITNLDVIDNDILIPLTNFPSLIAEKIPDYFLNKKIENVVGTFGLTNETYEEFFVDTDLGNDSNDGKSSNSPFQSLNPIFEKINKGRLKIDIILKSGQTFMLPFNTNDGTVGFSACTIHFRRYGGSVNPIITRNLEPIQNKSMVFYNCHLNFSNVDITKIGYDFYFDGGSAVFNNCNIDSKVTFWGSMGRFTNCLIKTLKSRSSNIWIESTTDIAESNLGCIDAINSKFVIYRTQLHPDWNINNETTASAYFNFVGCNITIYGVSNIHSETLILAGKLFNLLGSSLFLSSFYGKDTEYSCNNQSNITCSQIVSTDVRYNAFSTVCDGLNVSDGSIVPQV